MPSPTAIERAAVFALLDPETATWATPLARGLTARAFTDTFCRLCFTAICAAHRREDALPTERDLARRYGWCQLATALIEDAEIVHVWTSETDDPTHHIPPETYKRPITQEEYDAWPEFLRECWKPGDMIEDTRPQTVVERIKLRPVDELIQTADFTDKQIRDAFGFLQAHRRT